MNASSSGADGEHLRAPLAHLRGAVPPAPAWFERAMAEVPERTHVTVAGARIETLAWGEVGHPGLLLMHGNAATADLWRFVAPFFSGSHRVVALSWSGMGDSDRRDAYSLPTFRDEALAVAEARGLFASKLKPIFAGHSAGGGPTLLAAAEQGERLAGAIAIDTLVRPPEEIPAPQPARPHRVYPTLVEALAHFRFAPVQPCTNLYLADMIARAALRPVDGGWSWRFDPALWRNLRAGMVWSKLGSMRCPVALLNGSDSQTTRPPRISRMLAQLPAGTVNVVVPETHHHLMVDQPLAFVAALRALVGQWHPVTVASRADLEAQSRAALHAEPDSRDTTSET